jgi:tetratricopeptide (TPR) repeat protein
MKWSRYLRVSTALIVAILMIGLYAKNYQQYQSTLLFLNGHDFSSLEVLEKTKWENVSAASYLHYLLTDQHSSLISASKLNPNHYWYIDLVLSNETVEHFPHTLYNNRSLAYTLFLSDKALQEARKNTPETKYKGLFLAYVAKTLYPHPDNHYTFAEILRNSYQSYTHAEKMYIKALQEYPTNMSYWRSYGYCLNSMKDHWGKLSCYAIQERLDSTSVGPKVNIAKTLDQMGYFDEAVERIKYLISEDPNRIDFYLALGSIYTRNKEYVKAEEHYQKAIDHFPQEPVAYYELGNYFYSQKEYRKALLQHTKAIGMSQTQKKSISAWWWYRKGLDYYQLKDYEGAVKSFHKAMDISKSSSFTYWLGRSYEALEDYEKAIQQYDAYLIDHPDNKSVQTFRENCMEKWMP